MSGNTMAGAPATTEGAMDPNERELNYSFTGRVALTVVFVLFGLTVAIIIMRVLLYVLVYRSGRGRGSGGGGGLAAGILRSINSFGRMGSRRHGLDASALSALPVTVFRKEAGSTSASAAGTDCAVCLSELADGDTVRQLPNCGHVFHVECVDAWLRTTTTCPLCRSEAELSRGKAEAAAPSSSSSGTEAPQPTLLGAGGTLMATVQGGSADTRRDVRR